MANADMHKRLIPLGVLLLPVVTVKLSAILLGRPNPQAASAQVPAPVAQQTAADAAKPRQYVMQPKERAAAEYAATLRDLPFGPSPLLMPETAAPVLDPQSEQADHDPIEMVQTTPDAPPMPNFTLGAIMSSSQVKRALINGRPYVEGDQVRGTSWVVKTIDINTRSVHLADRDTDRTITVSVELELDR